MKKILILLLLYEVIHKSGAISSCKRKKHFSFCPRLTCAHFDYNINNLKRDWGSWAVPSGYPNPTRYPVFHLIPDPTQFCFRNHRVAGNPKHRVLPDTSGKPEVSGTTRYFGYHP